MENRPVAAVAGYAVLAIVVVAAAVACVVILLRDTSGTQGSGLPKPFTYDLEAFKHIDPALIRYRQTAEFPVDLTEPREIAVGLRDHVFIAGDQSIVVLDPEGKQVQKIALESEPRALAIGDEHHAHPGRIYVAMKSHVEVFEPDGKRIASWGDLGAKALLTSIAVGEQDVVAADAQNRVVDHYNSEGKLLNPIGRRDEARQIPGFIIPSPYFDVAFSSDGLVRVANPGLHRIEGYTLDGHLEVFWGQASQNIDGFCGCCNPAHFAILPDGRFVTAEKGIPRVKILKPDGTLDCVVAGPDTLAPGATIIEETRDAHRLPVVSVAADRQGRILVLDPGAKKVRRFEPIQPAGGPPAAMTPSSSARASVLQSAADDAPAAVEMPRQPLRRQNPCPPIARGSLS
jgi:hypothetical protein